MDNTVGSKISELVKSANEKTSCRYKLRNTFPTEFSPCTFPPLVHLYAARTRDVEAWGGRGMGRGLINQYPITPVLSNIDIKFGYWLW